MIPEPCPIIAHVWWKMHPPIGFYIAVLAFLGVIMPWLFRSPDQMKKREKAVWTGVMFLLLLGEIHSISRDRIEHDEEQDRARCEQTNRFGEIAEGIKQSIARSDQQFRETMGGIKTTMAAANITLKQTRPHSAFRIENFLLLNPPGDGQMFGSNISYLYNINFYNDGEEGGIVKKRMARLYVGKPDDKDTQVSLSNKFDEEWAKPEKPEKQDPTEFTTFAPHSPGLWSEEATFSKEDEEALRYKGYTVYLLARMRYLDSTGMWETSKCTHIQAHDNGLDLKVAHPCFVFSDPRRQVKPQ
jgi:hypothetical protein